MQSHGFRDTRRLLRRPARPGTFAPSDPKQLARALDPNANIALPIRVRGAGSSATDCNESPTGTVLQTTKLNRIVNIDAGG